MHIALPAGEVKSQFFEGPPVEVLGETYQSKFVILSGVLAVDNVYIGYAHLYDLDGMQFESACIGTKAYTLSNAQDRLKDWVQTLVDQFELGEIPCPYALS